MRKRGLVFVGVAWLRRRATPSNANAIREKPLPCRDNQYLASPVAAFPVLYIRLSEKLVGRGGVAQAEAKERDHWAEINFS